MESVLESELEQRFIDALSAWADQQRDVTLQPLPIRGKLGWMLTINGQEWLIEPQAPVGFEQGVAAPSRPDFLLRPRQLHASAPRPVAVFTDGFAYHAMPQQHQARLGDDVTKRQALIDSGRFWVWTITWDDVMAFAGEKPVDSLLNNNQQKLLNKFAKGAPFHWHHDNGVQQLIAFLATPDASKAREYAGAFAVSMLERHPSIEAGILAERRRVLLAEPTPPRLDIPDDAPPGDHLYGIHQQQALQLLVDIAKQALHPPQVDAFSVTLRMDDREEARFNENFKTRWRHFWLYTNIFQFLPGFAAATSQQIIEQTRLQPLASKPYADQPLPVSLSSDWQEAFEYADPACASLLKTIQTAGLPPPVVGYELADHSGRIAAQSELAWPDVRIALIFPDQSEDMERFQSQSWRVFPIDVDPQAILQALSMPDEVI
jgi:DEAD/DEAH box helicase domain-containing protein